MARFSSRRSAPVSTAILMWEIWMRLPKRQRRWVLAQARRHGPRMARQAYAKARKR